MMKDHEIIEKVISLSKDKLHTIEHRLNDAYNDGMKSAYKEILDCIRNCREGNNTPENDCNYNPIDDIDKLMQQGEPVEIPDEYKANLVIDKINDWGYLKHPDLFEDDDD